jgi:hypothetical protein
MSWVPRNVGEIVGLDAPSQSRRAPHNPDCEHAIKLVQKVEGGGRSPDGEDLRVRMVGGEPAPGSLQRFSQLEYL